MRYFNPVGAHESGLIGEDPNGLPNNLMPFITQVAIGKHDYLNVFGGDYDTADGTGVRDYIHVVDLAIGHLSALDYATKNHGIVTLNLGTGIGYSVLDVIHALRKPVIEKLHTKYVRGVLVTSPLATQMSILQRVTKLDCKV